jgi:hypothetical protein
MIYAPAKPLYTAEDLMGAIGSSRIPEKWGIFIRGESSSQI